MGQCSFNNKIYCIGGFDGSYSTNNLVYDPTTNIWQSKASMPTGRSLPLLAIANNKIYAIGSEANSTQNEEYNPATNIWTVKANAPTNFSETASIISYNNKIYVFGGEWSSVYSSVFVYDPIANSWNTYALPTGRKYIKTILFNNLIYLIGGNSGSSDVKTVETFNPVNNTTSSIASLNNIQGKNIDAFILNNKLYVAGNPNFIEEYNQVSNTWTVRTDFSPSFDLPGKNSSSFIVQNNQVFLLNQIPILFDFDNLINTTLKKLDQSNYSGLGSVITINNKFYLTGIQYGGSNGIKVVEFKLPSVYYIHCAN